MVTELELQQNLKCEEGSYWEKDLNCKKSNCEGNSKCDQTQNFKKERTNLKKVFQTEQLDNLKN